VHCWGESHHVVVAVMDCVIELHEDVAEDVHLLEAYLVHTKGFDDVSAFAALWVSGVNFSGHPMMGGHIIIRSTDNIGQIREPKLVSLSTRDNVAILCLESVVMGLWESGQRGS